MKGYFSNEDDSGGVNKRSNEFVENNCCDKRSNEFVENNCCDTLGSIIFCYTFLCLCNLIIRYSYLLFLLAS